MMAIIPVTVSVLMIMRRGAKERGPNQELRRRPGWLVARVKFASARVRAGILAAEAKVMHQVINVT
jgi:hypothetical protein